MFDSAVTKNHEQATFQYHPKQRAPRRRRLTRARHLRMEPLEDRRLLRFVGSNDNEWASSIDASNYHRVQDVIVDNAGNSLISGIFRGRSTSTPVARLPQQSVLYERLRQRQLYRRWILGQLWP